MTGAFEALEHHTLRYVWITLQACKVEVLKKLGGIDYHIPHMNKSKLAREGRLPDYLIVKNEIIYESLHHWDANYLEVALLYLGIEDQEVFHSAIKPTTIEPTTTEPTTFNVRQQEYQQHKHSTESTIFNVRQQ